MSELLRLTDVSKSYRRGSQELEVLRGANLHVQAGEVVCVLASRAEGKTTLLRIVAGIEGADAGLVSFEGQDLAACSDAQLSRLRGEKIAWAGKRGPRTGVQMFDYVANPMFARASGGVQSGNWIQRWQESRAYTRTVDERARAALERVGAAGCAEQHWETMSDWERALVELAHAIAAHPKLLLVDDVSDNLGILETKDFIGLVRAISKEWGLGVLMSVSDPHATLLSDRIMTLSGGRLTEAPQRPVTQRPPPSRGNVVDFPGVGSVHLEAGHASSSNT
jgi:ABC-type lipoprotein export system ATPase subunit